MSVIAFTPMFQTPSFPVRRFTVEEYHRMIQARVLGEDDPVELLTGWIVPQMSRNLPHDAILDLVNEKLRALLSPDWRLRIQSAITTADSEPEPDLAIVQGPASRYFERHPSGEEIALVVEVSETSLARDRGEKALVYASACIPQYWIVNIGAQIVEVYSEPTTGGYQSRTDYQMEESLQLELGGRELGMVGVRELFVG